MEGMAADRLGTPTDDLTSALITTNIDGEALTHAELASFFILLVVAGNETTRNAITHGLLGPHRAPRPAGPLAGRLRGGGRRRRSRRSCVGLAGRS